MWQRSGWFSVFGVLLVLFPMPLLAQLETVVLGKVAGYEQTTSGAPVAAGYAVIASASFISLPTGVTVSLQKPNGTVALSQDPDDAFSFEFEQEFATLSALNSSFPNGNYRFRLGGTASGTYTLALTSFGVPAGPRVINFDEAQQIDPNVPFTLRWENPSGATVDDIVQVLIEADDGSFFYDSNVQSGTVTQAQLGVLPMGRTFTAGILYARAVSATELGNGVVGGLAAVAGTEFVMRSVTPGPAISQVNRDVSIPAGGELVLLTNASGPGTITFRWQRRLAADAGTANWTDVFDGPYFVGSGTPYLRLRDAQRSMSGDDFRCVVTNEGGSTASGPVTVTVAPPYVITTLAGQASVAGGTDATGAAARFVEPRRIAVDPSGVIFITDREAVRKMTAAGEVVTLAGQYGGSGTTDGSGADARFIDLAGVAIDAAGFVYVSDRNAHTIRRIAPTGETVTWAGSPLSSGSANGVGAQARFSQPGPLAVDSVGNLFVADVGNYTIRRIATDRTVTTFAGFAGSNNYVDGTGSEARFGVIGGLAIDTQGNLFVADTGNKRIRQVTPQAVVTSMTVTGGVSGWHSGPGDIAFDPAGFLWVTDGIGFLRRIAEDGTVSVIAGRLLHLSHQDGSGGTMQGSFSAVAVGWAGTIYFCDLPHQTVRSARPQMLANMAVDATPPAVIADESATLSVDGTVGAGVNVTYQWRLNGIGVPGATASEYRLPSAQEFDAGSYSVVVSGDDVILVTAPITLTVDSLAPSPPSRLANLSTRAVALIGENVLIPGFVVAGPGSKQLLIRAVGPTLGTLGVVGVLPNPRLTLKRWNGTAYDDVATNDDWGTNANAAAIIAKSAELYAFPLIDGSADAALLIELQPGQYSAVADDAGTGTGIAIVEFYDADTTGGTAQLINLSNRGYVGTGDSIMIPGFVVSSEGPKTLLIRAVGPTLSTLGVSGALADPKFVIYRRNQTTNTDELILTNDDWGVGPGASRTRDVAAQLLAFALPEGSKDAAFVVTLNPGVYTVHARGANDSTGVALVEVYAVP